MAYIVVKQRRSLIGAPKKVALVVRSLGLGRIGQKRAYRDTRALRGQVRKIAHLVDFEITETPDADLLPTPTSNS